MRSSVLLRLPLGRSLENWTDGLLVLLVLALRRRRVSPLSIPIVVRRVALRGRAKVLIVLRIAGSITVRRVGALVRPTAIAVVVCGIATAEYAEWQ